MKEPNIIDRFLFKIERLRERFCNHEFETHHTDISWFTTGFYSFGITCKKCTYDNFVKMEVKPDPKDNL